MKIVLNLVTVIIALILSLHACVRSVIEGNYFMIFGVYGVAVALIFIAKAIIYALKNVSRLEKLQNILLNLEYLSTKSSRPDLGREVMNKLTMHPVEFQNQFK